MSGHYGPGPDGAELRRLREAAGLSAREVAAQLGIKHQTVLDAEAVHGPQRRWPYVRKPGIRWRYLRAIEELLSPRLAVLDEVRALVDEEDARRRPHYHQYREDDRTHPSDQPPLRGGAAMLAWGLARIGSVVLGSIATRDAHGWPQTYVVGEDGWWMRVADDDDDDDAEWERLVAQGRECLPDRQPFPTHGEPARSAGAGVAEAT